MSEQRIEWLGVEFSTIDKGEEPSELNQIEKIAQRRNFLDWLHEKVNVPRRMAETFSNVYGDVMNTLREVDDRIRQEYAANLKTNITEAKRALKERRYLDIVHFLAEFNESLKKITEQGKLLHQLRGEQIGDFYGDSQHFDWSRDYFGKSAGFMDVFRPLTRPMAGRIMERMYQNSLRERYQKMDMLLRSARETFRFVMARMKTMGAARARGDVSDYLAQLDQVAKRRLGFENTFRQVYTTEITPMIERMRAEREQSNQEPTQEQEEVPPESAAPMAAPVVAPQVQPEAQQEEEPMDISIETEDEPQAVPAVTREEAQQMAQAMVDDGFLFELVSKAVEMKNSKASIVDMLLKYSEALDDIDEELASIKCLVVAEGLMDE